MKYTYSNTKKFILSKRISILSYNNLFLHGVLTIQPDELATSKSTRLKTREKKTRNGIFLKNSNPSKVVF